MSVTRFLRSYSVFLLLLALVSPSPSRATEGDIPFEVSLIWGTNDDKPDKPELKEIGPDLKKKLCAVFKWKNYFQVKKEPLTIPKGGVNKVKLSDKCEVEIQDAGMPMIEVRLFGQGKLVKKVKQAVTPEELVLAGDDKNGSAWFVVVALKSK
jgi:hypothetical protein